MARTTLPGNPPIEILLKPSRQARRVSLRVSGIDGRVSLSYPARLPQSEALSFAREKADWLRERVAARPEALVVAPGMTLPVEGRALPVVADNARGVRVRDGCIHVAPERAGPALRAWLKALARDRLAAAAGRHAAALGRPHGRITLRDTRSRWGSCTARGDLMFSWRLVMAPPEVLDYVAAHEVAHLAHMHHGPAFWEAVARLDPDWTARRDWLRRDGAALHRYVFDD